MVVVMGRVGDSGDEPPHPFGGGFGDHQNDGEVEAARVQAPTSMDQQHWNATIDHFLTEKHQTRSVGNKECRKKQVVKNHGGTCNYGSACFTKNLNRLEVFHRAHVNKKGEFVDPLVEDQYNALVAEVALQTHHIADSGCDQDAIDWITIFEKVLGTQRGHVRGIVPKSSSAVSISAPSNDIHSHKHRN
ncbi:unnamed protein product [Lactuca saligna]|uniref:Uncharacterized protein n=1 Tax=Lactuca saligna TaxID=75948 RepID=A0AA35YZ23_LACSI|nr:unnamed protein product [Lactuca saligna]